MHAIKCCFVVVEYSILPLIKHYVFDITVLFAVVSPLKCQPW